MSSDINRPFGEVVADQLIGYAHLVDRGALQVGNDTSITCIGPDQNHDPGTPKIWAFAIVTKDGLKANLFTHAINLIMAIILFAAEMSRRQHQAQIMQSKGETGHGS